VCGFGRFGVDGDVAFFDQPLDRSARQARELEPQKSVETIAWMRVFYE
jgi:hypothetical protein